MPDKKNYYNIITDTWNLLKDHLESADFDKVNAQVVELNKKYKETPEFDFARAAVVAVMNEINRLHGGEV